MQLLALTAAEIAFLNVPNGAPAHLPERFARKLAAKLTACLRLPVQVHLQAIPAALELAPGSRPDWQPDDALSTLWLVRRLGGQRMTGIASFVPKGLLMGLDTTLAECWLDAPAMQLPPALAWQITTPLGDARLGVQLPAHSAAMTRWAREVISHVD